MNNSDILFIYDAKMCNPNGDPDDENKPRMDYETGRNLVSDVRLKRYIRDYLQGKSKLIFVSEVKNKTVDVTQRLAYWISDRIIGNDGESEDRVKKAKELRKTLDSGKTPDASKLTELFGSKELIDAFIDVRLFGATMPIKGERGESFTFTGPVQFNWGYSLHPVEMIESSTISSTFAGRTRAGEEEYGTFGKDYRLYYSLLAFHGIVSGKRAIHTSLGTKDIQVLEDALIHSIPLQATRSKIGQYPRLLIRVEYTDQEIYIGDLRRYIPEIQKEKIRDVSDFELDVNPLVNELSSFKEKIASIHWWQSKELKLQPEPLFPDTISSELKSKLKELDS